METWRAAYRYEHRYEVSTEGRVRITAEDAIGRGRFIGRILRPSITKGYSKYSLANGDKTRSNVLAHVLVAETFIMPRPDGQQINHVNGNKLDSRLENLEYVTAAQNYRHALINGLASPPKGAAHWSAVLSDEEIIEIRTRAKSGETHASLAQEFNCSIATVSRYRNCAGRAASVQ